MDGWWRKAWVATVAVCMAGVSPNLSAQSAGPEEGGEPIILGRRINIRSAVLNEDRPLLIYTPPGYDQSRDSYPVLYLLDGGDHFLHGSGVTRFLAANDRMPAMIVVGVPNLSQDGRTYDLTPPLTVPDTASGSAPTGGGSRFLEFLTDELRPWVETRYRTQPFSVLVGHSFGGLLITQALIEDPEAFEAYISISPSLWWDDERFVSTATSIFEDHPDLNSWLYMTMGDEGGTMLAGAWALTSILETIAPDSFRWKWSHMPEEDHGSVPHRSLYDGLEWLFDDWHLANRRVLAMSEGGEGWIEINEHYSRLSERFGFTVRMPENLVNQMGYALLREGRIEDAIRAFETNVELYPTSSNVYDSLGDAYDAACRWEEARDNYARAFEMALDAPDPGVYNFKANLDRMTAQLDAGEQCTARGAGAALE